MRWPWRREVRLVVCPGWLSALAPWGLRRPREILAEVFRARPGEVKEIIQRRLEESGLEEREEGL